MRMTKWGLCFHLRIFVNYIWTLRDVPDRRTVGWGHSLISLIEPSFFILNLKPPPFIVGCKVQNLCHFLTIFMMFTHRLRLFSSLKLFFPHLVPYLILMPPLLENAPGLKDIRPDQGWVLLPGNVLLLMLKSSANKSGGSCEKIKKKKKKWVIHWLPYFAWLWKENPETRRRVVQELQPLQLIGEEVLLLLCLSTNLFQPVRQKRGQNSKIKTSE